VQNIFFHVKNNKKKKVLENQMITKSKPSSINITVNFFIL